MNDHDPVNERERINRNGFKRHEAKLVQLSQPDEWASIRYGPIRNAPPQANKPTRERL